MSTQIQRRRGTTAQHATFTGALAEMTIDTDKNAPVVHDGVTPGGHPVARADHDHSGIYEPADATILKDADIGVTVQGKVEGGFGFRNNIINGAFRINQRAYVSGAATTAGQYTLDRWKVTGTGGITFSTTANKTTVTIPSGQALQQVVEGLNLQSDTYTLSWEGTAQGKIGAGSLSASPVSGAITGGTDTTIEFGPGTVANVQLEIGSVATPFEHRDIGTELALCQRYLPAFKSSSTSTSIVGGGIVASTTTGNFIIPFLVNARVAPTGISASAASHFSVYTIASGSKALTGMTFGGLGAGVNSASIGYTVASGLTAGQSAMLWCTSASGLLLFTGCEL